MPPMLTLEPQVLRPISLLAPEWHGGTFFFTGIKGTGKSSLAAKFEDPELVCFMDFDDGKGQVLDRQLRFGLYLDMMAEVARIHGPTYSPAQLYGVIDSAFRNRIAQDRYTVLVIDNVSRLEEALGAEIKRDPKLYGVDPERARSGAFGGVNPGVQNLISGYVALAHARGVKLVIAIAHTGNLWVRGGPVPGKWRFKGSERWQAMSILTLALIPAGPGRPFPPAALVQKQAFGELRFDRETGEFRQVTPLPARLPEATPAMIRHYMQHPADFQHPGEGEAPTARELDQFSDRLTPDQLKYMQLVAGESEDEAAPPVVLPPAPAIDPDLLAKAREAVEQGSTSPALLATALGIPVPKALPLFRAVNGN